MPQIWSWISSWSWRLLESYQARSLFVDCLRNVCGIRSCSTPRSWCFTYISLLIRCWACCSSEICLCPLLSLNSWGFRSVQGLPSWCWTHQFIIFRSIITRYHKVIIHQSWVNLLILTEKFIEGLLLPISLLVDPWLSWSSSFSASTTPRVLCAIGSSPWCDCLIIHVDQIARSVRWFGIAMHLMYIASRNILISYQVVDVVVISICLRLELSFIELAVAVSIC